MLRLKSLDGGMREGKIWRGREMSREDLGVGQEGEVEGGKNTVKMPDTQVDRIVTEVGSTNTQKDQDQMILDQSGIKEMLEIDEK